MVNNEDITILYPLSYITGIFVDSDQNWATLTKEVCIIYVAFEKLSYHLYDTEVNIRCNHTPLRKHLTAHTLNLKVKNW